MTYRVVVNGLPKGEVYRQHGKWWWRRERGGVDPFVKGTGLDDIKAFIARVCLSEVSQVVFSRND